MFYFFIFLFFFGGGGGGWGNSQEYNTKTNIGFEVLTPVSYIFVQRALPTKCDISGLYFCFTF